MTLTASRPTALLLPPQLRLNVAALLILLGFAATFLFSGCGSTPEAIAYHTLNDTRILVDGAERHYGDAVAQGKVSQERQDEADEAIVRFHAAYKLAAEAFPGYFGIFYKTDRATKNANEQRIIAKHREKTKDLQMAQAQVVRSEKMSSRSRSRSLTPSASARRISIIWPE